MQAHPKTVHQAQAWPEKMTHQGSAVHTVCFCPENCDARRVTDQVRQADYLGVESGYKTDKLKNVGFTTSRARTVCAPVINELLLSLECQVVHTVTVGSHMQITGEVKNILADEDIVDEKGRILLDRLRPVLYNEEQVEYLSPGRKVSDAFKPGAAWKKELDGGKEHG